MKTLIIILLTSFFVLKTAAQKNKFNLEGKIEGLVITDIDLLIEPATDSNIRKYSSKDISIRNNHFYLQGEIAFPHPVRFIINKNIYSEEFFLEKGILIGKIFMNSENKIAIDIQSTINNEFKNKFAISMLPINKEFDSWYDNDFMLQKNYNHQIPSYKKDSMILIKNKLIFKRDLLLYDYIKKNIYSYVGFWNLKKYINSSGYTKLRYKSYNLLPKELKLTPTGLNMITILKGDKILSLGNKFPFIKLVDTNEKEVMLRYKSKRYTLVDFWFSSCGPCIQQFPDLLKLYSKFKNKDFDVIGISIDRYVNKREWLEAIKNYNLIWKQYWDKDNLEALRLGISTFPQNFLLDDNGVIIKKDIYLKDLENFLLEKIV